MRIGAARTWWQRTVRQVSADLAVHGLAYLGVLLLFAGVFGFVAFAFGEVDRSLRPLAEVAIAVSFFGVSAFLQRRGAPFVAAAVGLLGGAVVPVLIIASVSDRAWVPPDPEGGALVVSLVSANLVLASIYLAVSRRRPTSPLRFVVAPAVWLAGAAAGLAFVDPIPSGEELTTPLVPEWALAALAVAVTVVVARRWSGPVARATVLVATPGIVLTYVLTVVAAGREGWPEWWLAIAGIAALVALDQVRGVLPDDAIGATQSLLVAAGGVTLVPGFGWGWAGACAAGAAVVLGERSARTATATGPAPEPSVAPRDDLVVVSRLVVLTGAALVSAAAPWPSLVVALVVWGVGLLRLERPSAWLPRRFATALVATMPVLAASAVMRLLDPGPGLVIDAAGVLAAAVGVRALHRTDQAPWRWWVPGSAALIVITSGAVSAGWGALGAALATLTLLVAPGRVPVRVWAAAVAGTVSGTLAADRFDLGRDARALALGAVGLGLVSIAVAVRRPLAGHLGVIGHLLTGGAVAVAFAGQTDPVAGTVGAVAVGVLAAGSLVTAGARELGGSTVVDLLARSIGQAPPGGVRPLTRTVADLAPLGVAVPAVAATAGVATSTLGDLDWFDPWCAAAAGAALGATVLAGRAMLRHDDVAGRVTNRLAFALLALVAVPAALPDALPGAIASAVLVGAVLAVGKVLRTRTMHVAAWAGALAGSLDAAHALGLDRSSLHQVALVWGIVAVLGALAVDELVEGRAAPGELVRRVSLRPALLFGPATIAGGLACSYLGLDGIGADEPRVWGGWSLTVAVTAGLVALRRRVADPTFVTWPLVVVAYAGIVPDDPLRPPWPYVVGAGAMAVVAFAVRGRGPSVEAPWWIAGSRWDVPPLGAGAATLAFALRTSVTVGWMPATFLGGGFVVAAVGAAFGWIPLVPVGAALAIIGAMAAGHGAAALAFAITSVVATAAATRRSSGVVRIVLQWTGSLAAVAAWTELVAWRGWHTGTVGASTALASGGVLLALSVGVNVARRGRDWALAWGAPWGAALSVATAVVLGTETSTRAHETALAGGLASAALACALAAAPLRVGVLREVASALAVSAAVVLGDATRLGPTGAVLLALVGSMIATTFVVAANAARRAQVWTRPALVLGFGATGVALVVAGAHLPERDLLTAALAATGLQAAALGLGGRRRAYLLASPAILCAAWITFASGSLTGDPQWFTIPVGLTVLIVVGLARGDLRRNAEPVAPPVLVALDLTGMAFVVGAALGRTVTESIAYGAIAIGSGVVIAVWGVLTRVRRRLAFGVGTVTLAVVLMFVGPLVDLVPQIHGATLWLVIAAFGVVAITIAAFLERGRAAVRSAVAGVRTLTADWE